MKSNDTKTDQLGMPIGTASNRLRKSVIFNLLKKHNENFCFQCGAEIESEKDLSLEHKIPYLHSSNPVELFFDVDNVAFSHLTCNVGAARNLRTKAHPSTESYKQGCRCPDCTRLHTECNARWRQRKKLREQKLVSST